MKTIKMISCIKHLNEIIRNFSKENAINSISQLASIISLCKRHGIRFTYDVNYEEALASFRANKFPEWNAEVTNREIESLANQGKYEAAAVKREETLTLKNKMHRQFRLEKYQTGDWFIEKSESDIFFLPTGFEIIDSLVQGNNIER